MSTTTPADFESARQAGLAAGPAEKCPHTGLLAAAWRSGWRQARADRREARQAAGV